MRVAIRGSRRPAISRRFRFFITADRPAEGETEMSGHRLLRPVTQEICNKDGGRLAEIISESWCNEFTKRCCNDFCDCFTGHRRGIFLVGSPYKSLAAVVAIGAVTACFRLF
jgi:hypothetical protein